MCDTNELFEMILIIVIVFIAVYISISLLFGLNAKSAVPVILGGAFLHNLGGVRSDNLEPDQDDPAELLAKIKKSDRQDVKHYDEYDDAKLLGDPDTKAMDSFDNIVIDGNNFLYKFGEFDDSKSLRDGIGMTDYLKYISKSVALMSKHFKDKKIYFVFKDPETDKQHDDLLKATQAKTVRAAHKQIFEQYAMPNIHYVVAHGDSKYRDDFAAIWLADVLPNRTILLSRDRFRDVGNMSSKKIKFATYGNDTAKLNKIINKPYTQVSKGVVIGTLVGYAFSHSKKSGFYNREVNKKSQASDMMYIFNIRKTIQ